MADKKKCKEKVYPNERFGSFHPHRCRRNVWQDGYCRIHHPSSVQDRQLKSKNRYEEKQKLSPWYRLREALEKIKQLEAEIENLKRR